MAVIATSESDESPWLTIALAVTAGAAFVSSGLIALALRPDNRTGVYLAATGYVWFLAALSESTNEWLFTIGFVLGNLVWVPFSALVLAYPTGRLQTRLERALPAVAGVTLITPALLAALLDSSPADGCDSCPGSAIALRGENGAGAALDAVATVGGLVLIGVVVTILVRRWRGASRTLRRVLWPVVGAGIATLLSVALVVVANLFSESAAGAFQLLFFVAFATVPLSFLFGILRTRLARSSATNVVLAIERGVPLRDALADALGDATVEVAYRLDPERGLGGAGWIDAWGRAVPEPTPSEGRTVRFIERDGSRVAAIACDASLMHEPEMLEAVTAAAGLAIANERLQAALRAEIRLAGALSENAPALLSNVDTEGRILKLNAATLRASGYETEAELLGTYFWDVFIDDSEREAMKARFAAAAPDFPANEYENRFTNARSEELVIYWRAAPVVDDAGKVLSIVAGGLDITERHRLEAEKEREREFLNAIANNAPSLLCLIDEHGRVTNQGANIAFERTLEREPSDIGGELFWMRYVHPDDADEVRERIERVVAGETLGEHDNYWVTGTGRRLLIAWTCTPLPRLDERRIFLITGIDVTERKQRESEIRETRDFLQTVVSTIPSLLVTVDGAARIVKDGVNRAFIETFGWSGWESTGRSFLELVHPEDAYTVRMAIAAAANGVPQEERESRWLPKDGSALFVAWTARPVLDPEGRSVVLVSGMDVTERKQRETEALSERDFLNTVANSIPSLLTLVDAEGVVTDRGLNHPFTRTLGHVDENAVGRPLWEVVAPEDDAGRLEQSLRAAIGRETVSTGEGPWKAADGSIRLVEWTVIPTLDLGRPRWLISATDITERKRQEEEIRASRGRIVEAADEARRKLERNLHDGAQQRLVALSVQLRLAESKLHEDPEGATALVAGAREELAHALEELRELARGIHPAVLTDRGLGPALEALASRVPIPVTLEQPDERLAPAVEAAAYYVVAEALTNVTKYAQASSVDVRVSKDGDRIEVDVRDDGVGGADPEAGSGLRGLEDRLAALDGILRVESRSGEGTRVHAEIPLTDARP